MSEIRMAGRNENFIEIKSFLEKISQNCMISNKDSFSLIVKTIKHGLIFWDYKPYTNEWNIYYSDEIKIKNIDYKDLITDYFLGSRFEKYYSLLNTIRNKKLSDIYDDISANNLITAKERNENVLTISYFRNDFKITFDTHTLKFDLEYIPFEFYRKDIAISKMRNIEFLLDSTVDSYNAYENGY